MGKAKGTKKAAAEKPLIDWKPKVRQGGYAAGTGKHGTPFTTDDQSGEIVDSLGNSIADCETVELAKFVVGACNNYHALKQLARLSRGEVECEDDERYLYKSAAHKAMRELFGQVDSEVLHD